MALPERVTDLTLAFPITEEQWDAGLSETDKEKLFLLAVNALVGKPCCENTQKVELSVSVVGGGGIGLSAGSFSQNTGVVTFADSNGISFGMNSLGVVTASASGGGGANSLSVSAGTTNSVLDQISFGNGGGVSFGLDAGSVITASHGIKVTAGTTNSNLSQLSFANGNGITFGLNNSTITALHNALTSQSNQAFSASGGSSAFQTLVFLNTNGVTFSNNGGSVQASVAAGGGGSLNVSAGTTSNDLTAITFANANGITFGLNASTLTASHNGLTSQSNQNVTAANGGFAFQTLSFSDANGISFGTSAGSAVTASHNALTTQSGQAASASNGSFAFQTLGFSNGNGVTFGTSAGSIISASVASSLTAINVSAGTASNNLSAVTFSNSNGITFGLDGSTVTASHNGLTTQSGQVALAANGSFAFETLSFSNANGITFATAAGSAISASYTVPSTAGLISAVNFSGGTTSNALSAITFGNANGITFGLDGSTMTGSHNGLTSQSGQAFSASGGSSTFQTLSFGNANLVTFENTNGSVGIQSLKLSMFAVSNTTLGTDGTQNHTALSFAGAGVASVGVTNGSVVISVPAGGGGLTNINLSAGTTSQNLSAMVFSNSNNVTFGLNGSTVTGSAAIHISAGTSSAALSSLVFSNSNGVSFGLNGSTVTASVTNGRSVSWYENIPYNGVGAIISITDGNSHFAFIQPFLVQNHIAWSRMNLMLSRASAQSNLFTVDAGIYTFVNSTQLSLLGSVQNTYSASNTASVSNQRLLAITNFPAGVTNLTPGQYALGLIFSAGATASVNYIVMGGGAPIGGGVVRGEIHPGADQASTANTSEAQLPFFGRISVSQTILPNSIAQSDIRARYSSNSQAVAPYFRLRQF